MKNTTMATTFYVSPLFTFGKIHVRDDPSKLPQNLDEKIKEEVMFPGTEFEMDPSDDLESWLDKQYNRTSSREWAFPKGTITTRPFSPENLNESMEEHVWETIDDAYFRVFRVDYINPIPRKLLSELNERGYKEALPDNPIVIESDLLDYP